MLASATPFALSAYNEPIVVEKEKYGLWHLGHTDDRVQRAERKRDALERGGAAMAALGMATMGKSVLKTAPSYTPSFAELAVLPKWTPARWTNAHRNAPSMPAKQLPVLERYKRAATGGKSVGSLMEAGRQEAKERAMSRIRTPLDGEFHRYNDFDGERIILS